jgi:hypothetical protein
MKSIGKQSVLRTISIVTTCLYLAGCSAVDNVMRAQPSTGFSSALVKNPAVSGSGTLPLNMVVYAISFDGKTINPVPEEEGLGSELFLTVDISGVIKGGLNSITVGDERKIINFLLYVSDHNATLWMTRIYALNKARHGLAGGLKDLTTAGSGLSAFLSPPAAASLGAASLLIGGGSDEIDKYIYSGDTIEVLFKGIEAARAVQLKAITDKLAANTGSGANDYDIFTALTDVKEYDSLVSFRKGLEYLASIADATTAKASGSKVVATPAPPK